MDYQIVQTADPKTDPPGLITWTGSFDDPQTAIKAVHDHLNASPEFDALPDGRWVAVHEGNTIWVQPRGFVPR